MLALQANGISFKYINNRNVDDLQKFGLLV